MSLDEYWSVEPNRDREEGVTYPRLFALAECSRNAERLWLYNLGAVFNAAATNPAELKKLLAPPVARVEATGMIRIPKKKKR